MSSAEANQEHPGDPESPSKQSAFALLIGPIREFIAPFPHGVPALETSGRPRSDIARDESSYDEFFKELWRQIKTDLTVFAKLLRKSKESLSWRIPIAGSNSKRFFRIMITDAASPHTDAKMEVAKRKKLPAMVIIWFGIEDRSGNLLVDHDDITASPGAIFSNQQFFNNDKRISVQERQELVKGVKTAINILKEQLLLKDDELSDTIDITMSIGTRYHRLESNHMPRMSQSSPLGHCIVTYHPPEEQKAESHPPLLNDESELVKLIDPWIRILLIQFPEVLPTIGQKIAQQSNINCIIKARWDGIEITSAEQELEISDAYKLSSLLYQFLSTLQKYIYQYYVQLTFSPQVDSSATKNKIISELGRFDIQPTTSQELLQYFLSLKPPIGMVIDMAQKLLFQGESAELSFIEKFHHKYARKTSPKVDKARSRTLNAYRKRLSEIIAQLPEEENEAPDDVSQTRKKEISILKTRIEHLRSRLLLHHILKQIFLGKSKKSDSQDSELDAELETIFPTRRLAAVNVIKDFSLREGKLSVVRMFFTLSATGRGPFETAYGFGIKRPRPA